MIGIPAKYRKLQGVEDLIIQNRQLTTALRLARASEKAASDALRRTALIIEGQDIRMDALQRQNNELWHLKRDSGRLQALVRRYRAILDRKVVRPHVVTTKRRIKLEADNG